MSRTQLGDPSSGDILNSVVVVPTDDASDSMSRSERSFASSLDDLMDGTDFMAQTSMFEPKNEEFDDEMAAEGELFFLGMPNPKKKVENQTSSEDFENLKNLVSSLEQILVQEKESLANTNYEISDYEDRLNDDYIQTLENKNRERVHNVSEISSEINKRFRRRQSMELLRSHHSADGLDCDPPRSHSRRAESMAGKPPASVENSTGHHSADGLDYASASGSQRGVVDSHRPRSQTRTHRSASMTGAMSRLDSDRLGSGSTFLMPRVASIDKSGGRRTSLRSVSMTGAMTSTPVATSMARHSSHYVHSSSMGRYSGHYVPTSPRHSNHVSSYLSTPRQSAPRARSHRSASMTGAITYTPSSTTIGRYSGHHHATRRSASMTGAMTQMGTTTKIAVPAHITEPSQRKPTREPMKERETLASLSSVTIERPIPNSSPISCNTFEESHNEKLERKTKPMDKGDALEASVHSSGEEKKSASEKVTSTKTLFDRMLEKQNFSSRTVSTNESDTYRSAESEPATPEQMRQKGIAHNAFDLAQSLMKGGALETFKGPLLKLNFNTDFASEEEAGKATRI